MRSSLRDDLLQSLGMIAAPIKNAAENGTLSAPEVAILRAKATQDLERFQYLADSYCRFGNLFLREEFNWIVGEARKVADLSGALGYPESREELTTGLARQLKAVRDRINNVPIEITEDILAPTPFQIFLRLREMIAAAEDRVEIFDPYVDATIFYRYLAETNAEVDIAVVTTAKRFKGGWSELERQRLIDIASLFAGERGPKFRLLVLEELHDRHVRIDGIALHLGGSIKDAGRGAPYTVSRLAPQANETLDALLAIAKQR